MKFKMFDEPGGNADPVGYVSGYFVGRFKPPEAQMKPEDLAGDSPAEVAFRNGYEHGSAIREGRKPIPPWDDGEPERIYALILSKKMTPPQMVAGLLRQAVDAGKIPVQIAHHGREKIFSTADKMERESISYEEADFEIRREAALKNLPPGATVIKIDAFQSPFAHQDFAPPDPQMDGLTFFCGYVYGLTTGEFRREISHVSERFRLEELALEAGFNLGRDVRLGRKPRPSWHPDGIDGVVQVLSARIITPGQFRQMMHGPAKDSEKHDCEKWCNLTEEEKKQALERHNQNPAEFTILPTKGEFKN